MSTIWRLVPYAAIELRARSLDRRAFLGTAAASAWITHALTGCRADDGAPLDGPANDDGDDTAASGDASSSSSGPGSGDEGSSDGASSGEAPVECEAIVTTFPEIVDVEPTTTFTRMDQSTLADWIVIGTSASKLMKAHVPAAVLRLLEHLGTLRIGYPVDLLTHSLQTATRAVRDNASDDLVLAALCHDIGCALTIEGHAEVAAAILRDYVSEDAYRVVRHHTEFEWKHYGALVGQPTDQRDAYGGQPWFADAQRFADAWEVAAYDPSYDTMPLAEFEPLVIERFGNGSLANDLTAGDCIPGLGGR